ncbi:MAG: EAL domain-containing protein [Geminicoccaceae bacterium]|nr:EAL domain-containing protein [Geminicoccaceae bacterium]
MSWFHDLETELDRAPCAAVVAISLPHLRGSIIAGGADFGEAVVHAIIAGLEDRFDGRLVSRSWGQEIFAVISGVSRLEEISKLASTIEAAFDEPFHCMGRLLHIVPSIGISLSPDDGMTFRELLSKAQIAADIALHPGNGTQLFAGEMAENFHRAAAIEDALRDAVANRTLTLAYQPQFDLNMGRFSGVEVLVRWDDPHLGPISPADFIPIAERSGVIPRLGGWVLSEATRQFSAHGAAASGLELAINVSPRQLVDRGFVFEVEEVLDTSGIRPEQLTIEITEGLMLHDIRATSATLNEVRSLGVRTAIDDFGAGFSNLAYLRNLPLDQLKIDRDFVKHLRRDPRSRTVLDSTIGLGHGLGLQVCVEGVESVEQFGMLQSLGCDLAQGFYLAHPCAIEQLDGHMRADYRRITGIADAFDDGTVASGLNDRVDAGPG